jgi:hypothetical protein
MSGRVSGSSFMPSQRDLKESSIQTVGNGRISDRLPEERTSLVRAA